MKAAVTKLIHAVVGWLFLRVFCLLVSQAALLSLAMATTRRNDWSDLWSTH